MATPCANCDNKFTALEIQDPEVSDLEVDEDGTVTATVRIVRSCEGCSEEKKEATLELSRETSDEEDKLLEAHKGDDHELSVEEDSVDTIEEGGGRYKKSYYGAEVSFTVKCSCDDETVFSASMSDKVAASAMDDL